VSSEIQAKAKLSDFEVLFLSWKPASARFEDKRTALLSKVFYFLFEIHARLPLSFRFHHSERGVSPKSHTSFTLCFEATHRPT